MEPLFKKELHNRESGISMNWYKKAQLYEGAKGTYFTNNINIPVTIMNKAIITVQGKNVEVWEAIDELSNRMIYIYNPKNFKLASSIK